MQRRDWLIGAGSLAVGSYVGSRWWDRRQSADFRAPTHSVVPVVGDGKWIWNQPPTDQTGYLEPRSFEVSIGLELQGKGDAGRIQATTPVPTEFPEQKIESAEVLTEGCEARIQPLAPGAAQLEMAAPGIAKGQIIRAVAKLKLTLTKQYLAFDKEQFPARQTVPADVRKGYLQDSPGIQTSNEKVRKLAQEIAAKQTHPWDQAEAISKWIRQNIQPQIGAYTGVATAMEKRRGDCEEMAAVFVAVCRSLQIPARLVWVPNHNWAEFYLTSEKGEGHWIPVHTACYGWFGWTGAHELVLQKGDRIVHPQKRVTQRLVEDWLQWQGARPDVRFVGELKPVAAPTSGSDADAGPGARRKEKNGAWKLTGEHPLDRYLRNA
ncbi:Transglutaminase-like superfamily protein [Anatilimnocola aggregata]|uniref:Transglutaminase-like superfamily protein n=1 Tax=Anatilimnocola aggregata TaxID=2528021 RepID=A0A517YJZ5_9BACT|nr:transglutaminase-like domain-containing protein [Anatilimnocola aggregata]QDU30544.1 Transglutaminase-like superfamily protein [Anatilimnocola aggregata]